MLEGAAGWKLTEEDWKNLVLRASIMERCVSIREGYVPSRDDDLPDRFFTETIHNKYGEPKTLNREKFLEARKKAYLSFGLNEEGVPSRKTLESLEMEFVIPTIEKKLGTIQ
jgi:aldehyde:ferredoxin oxidoreductase